MKKLSQIISTIEPVEVIGSADILISALKMDSRRVNQSSLFFAIAGTQVDGHNFIASAIESGAAAIVCQQKPQEIHPHVTYIVVEDTNIAVGKMAGEFYDNPSKKLTLVGITGTNGKTTIATLLYRLADKLGHKSGLISTINHRIGHESFESTHTTPNAIEINRLLNQMVINECSHCFMEVSSHAIHQHRIEGIHFSGAVFTNLSHDHLDYHHTFKEYINAKKAFFDTLPKTAFAITNSDDKNGMVMVQNTKAKVYTYSLRSMANFRCKIVEQLPQGMQLLMNGTEMWSRLIGGFNAYNLLAVYAVAQLLDFDQEETLAQLSAMEPVNGRFEHLIAPNGVIAVVDYAHTPDALENVLSTLNNIKPAGNRIFCVVGAGGNRDKTKRPIMTQIALAGSEMVILTSDNPRFEEPMDIINQMKEGIENSSVGRVLTIADRREAIRTACLLASPGDLVLIAGKGHENYQEIRGVRHHFDDKEEVIKVFNQMTT